MGSLHSNKTLRQWGKLHEDLTLYKEPAAEECWELEIQVLP